MNFTLLTDRAFILLLFVLGIGLAFLYSRFYNREARQARRLTPPQKRILWGLRALVVALALAALARPAVTLVHTTTRLPAIAFLVDESISMSFPDTPENPVAQANPPERRTRYDTAKTIAAILQDPLTQTHRARVYAFSDSVELLRELPHRTRPDEAMLGLDEIFANAMEPTGDYTHVGDALADTLRNLSEEKISGIILLSDGRQTGGLRIATAGEQAAQAGVPVHTIVFGTEHPLRDLAIADVHVSAEASLGDVLTFNVEVINQIQDRLTTTLTLEEEGVKVAERTITLSRGENNVPIATIPDVEGLREFTLKLPIQPDEVNTDNNEATVHVNVVRRSLRVLLIAGQPSREYFYAVPALLRDPVISLSTWLQNADVDYVQQGNVSLSRLPEDLETWQRYDVCILLDPDPNELSTQQITNIEDMVRRGGGLMIMGGRNYGLARLIQVHAARLRNLLPVEIDPNRTPDYFQTYDSALAVHRTPIGQDHPIMLASSIEERNNRVWETFPDFYWHHPVQRTKPDTVVLLETSAAAGRSPAGTPLMAIHRYGEGAVFYSGLNSLWRWRFPFENYDYDRLWTRAIRYLGETRLEGTQRHVSLSTDRTTYAPGEQVEIRLRLLDPALMTQLRGETLYASVTTPQGDEQMVSLQSDPNRPMLYTGGYRARRTGSTIVRSEQAAPGADSEARPLYDIQHAFRVVMQSPEHRDTSGDLDAMRTLADQTGGEYFDYNNMHEIETLADKIPAEHQELRRSVMVEIWDGWIFLALFLGLIGAEWSLRKWWGLL